MLIYLYQQKKCRFILGILPLFICVTFKKSVCNGKSDQQDLKSWYVRVDKAKENKTKLKKTKRRVGETKPPLNTFAYYAEDKSNLFCWSPKKQTGTGEG